MESNLISQYLSFSCLLLNRFSLFARKAEAVQLSTFLVVLHGYKT